jgi:hypothetical protein
MLEPVRESYRTNRFLTWQRVYNLPGFVYFHHRIHENRGGGCTSCHGRIEEMPFTDALLRPRTRASCCEVPVMALFKRPPVGNGTQPRYAYAYRPDREALSMPSPVPLVLS